MSYAKSTTPWRRRTVGLGLAMAVGLSLTACGGDDDDEDDAADEPADEPAESPDAGSGDGGDAVEYVVEAFEFADVSAPAGGTLDISNTSGAPHTFTSDDGEFDAEIPADDAATLTVPSEPGEYPFHCEIHASMQATLTVD